LHSLFGIKAFTSVAECIMAAPHIGNLGKDHNQIITGSIFEEPSHFDNEFTSAPAAM
jgi:hypothetical protein